MADSQDMAPFRLPNTDDPLLFFAAVATQPFPLMLLPKDIRLRILAKVVAPTGLVGVKLDPFPRNAERPNIFPVARFSNDLIALRTTCALLNQETGEAFFDNNTIVIDSLKSLTYLTRTLPPVSVVRVNAVFLSENAFYYSTVPTNAGMQYDHTTTLIEALNSFNYLTYLTITFPWNAQGQPFARLVRYLATHLRDVKELTIRRPHVDKLLPQNTLQHFPSLILVQPGLELSFVRRVMEESQLWGYNIPTNALDILADDALFITGINTDVGDTMKVYQSAATEKLARWVGSGEGWRREGFQQLM